MTESSAVRHFFCVGCPRSGTTLLQAMLARHSRVYSPPETHFFRKICKHRSWGRRVLGAAVARASRRALRHLLKLVERPDLVGAVPRIGLSHQRYARAFAEIMDRVARDHGADVWLEKTPPHLHYIPQITRAVPDARFIHIVRDGRDVVASWFQACLDEPQTWVHQVLPRGWETRLGNPAGRRRILDAIIDRWNVDIAISLARRDTTGHLLLTYAELLAAPRDQLERLCGFMALDFEPQMLQHWEAASDLVGFGSAHRWMTQTFRPLQDTHRKKYSRLFDEGEQRRIEQRLWEGGPVPAFGGS